MAGGKRGRGLHGFEFGGVELQKFYKNLLLLFQKISYYHKIDIEISLGRGLALPPSPLVEPLLKGDKPYDLTPFDTTCDISLI